MLCLTVVFVIYNHNFDRQLAGILRKIPGAEWETKN
jgi:hypothetical protein